MESHLSNTAKGGATQHLSAPSHSSFVSSGVNQMIRTGRCYASIFQHHHPNRKGVPQGRPSARPNAIGRIREKCSRSRG